MNYLSGTVGGPLTPDSTHSSSIRLVLAALPAFLSLRTLAAVPARMGSSAECFSHADKPDARQMRASLAFPTALDGLDGLDGFLAASTRAPCQASTEAQRPGVLSDDLPLQVMMSVRARLRRTSSCFRARRQAIRHLLASALCSASAFDITSGIIYPSTSLETQEPSLQSGGVERGELLLSVFTRFVSGPAFGFADPTNTPARTAGPLRARSRMLRTDGGYVASLGGGGANKKIR